MQALRPRGPYPLLDLGGEQGSAKSFTAGVLRSLVDPSTALLRSPPASHRDPYISATNSWCLAFDNLSHLTPAISDALCRISTGGALATRELHTNAEETILEAQRPVILTGIEEVAQRSDLLSRRIGLTLPRLTGPRPEAELLRELDEARPRLFGALLDAVVAGLAALPITTASDLADYLSAREDPCPALFVDLRARRRLSAHGVRTIPVTLRQRFPAELAIGLLRGAHVLRHTVATLLMEATGGDARLVQEVLGHASLSTLMNYTDVNAVRKMDAYRQLGALHVASRDLA